MTRLERRCRLLLRVYPAWYRRERGDEVLDTLLAVSPPGRRWPSLRDSRALVTGGLRVRGWVWLLSVLWAGLGVAGSVYTFVLSTHVSEPVNCALMPCWVGEPGVISSVAQLAAAVWLVLTIPVLVAGVIRLRGKWLRASAWAGAWGAGLALMIKVADWQTSAPMVLSCSKGQGCALVGYRYAVVSWAELPICAAWLALAAAITLILAGPPHGWGLSDAGSRSSTKASL